jgi:hypothetical protein
MKTLLQLLLPLAGINIYCVLSVVNITRYSAIGSNHPGLPGTGSALA